MEGIALRDSPEDLDALIGRASLARGIPQAFLEKDFWVTEVLRSVAEPLDTLIPPGIDVAPRAVFKGGTSLSRAYQLIQRFSEDIDILVDPGSLQIGSHQLDKLMERIDKRARPSILEPRVKARTYPRKGLYRRTEYGYPTRQPSPILRRYVLLEMGVRGRAAPTEQRAIRSLLAEVCVDDLNIEDATVVEFAPFTMEVLGPERTLIEKCAALHSAAAQFTGDPDTLRPLGRHLYDVHALLSADDVRARLKAVIGGTAALAADAQELSELHGWASTPRPEAGFASSDVFVMGTPANNALRAAYSLVSQLVYGLIPTFDDCIATIQEHRAIL